MCAELTSAPIWGRDCAGVSRLVVIGRCGVDLSLVARVNGSQRRRQRGEGMKSMMSTDFDEGWSRGVWQRVVN